MSTRKKLLTRSNNEEGALACSNATHARQQADDVADLLTAGVTGVGAIVDCRLRNPS